MTSAPLRVLITGAAGRIAYSLYPLLSLGKVFGPTQKLDLVLLDIPVTEKVLTGIKMELDDCAYSLLNSVTTVVVQEDAFKEVDIVIMLGAFPRKEGMQRVDLLQKNKSIFQMQATLIEKFAKKDVKIIVVGNPANTNALIISECAPSIPKEHITSLMRLDQNRSVSMAAKQLKCSVDDIHDIIVWGNHSTSQAPCVDFMKKTHGKPEDANELKTPANLEWYTKTMLPTVRKRGGDVISFLGASSSLSAANAIANQLRDWCFGAEGKIVTMGVVSDGSYKVPKGLVYGMPVHCKGGYKYEIVKDLKITPELQALIDGGVDELNKEKEMAFSKTA